MLPGFAHKGSAFGSCRLQFQKDSAYPNVGLDAFGSRELKTKSSSNELDISDSVIQFPSSGTACPHLKPELWVCF